MLSNTPFSSLPGQARFRRLAAALANYLLPRSCFVCSRPTNATSQCCSQCYTHLPFAHHACHRCGKTLAHNALLCGVCLQSPPRFDSCFCAFQYTAPISERIKTFKYYQRADYARSLAALLLEEIVCAGLPFPQALLPVPCYRDRLRQRGYNQSLLLTRQLSRLTGLPCIADALVKTRATPAQSQLSLQQRRRNLRGSFELRKQIDFKHIAIIDDVITSGATATEITKILQENGVDYVQVWGVAHTERDNLLND